MNRQQQLRNLPVFGGSTTKPWLIPFGHSLARQKEIAGGKGHNCSIQFEFTEGIASWNDYKHFYDKIPAELKLTRHEFRKCMKELKERKARVPFGYIPTVHFVEYLMKKHGIDLYYENLISEYDVHNLTKDSMEEIGLKMQAQIIAIKPSNEELEHIENALVQIEKITGKRLVSVRSNGIIEDGTYHGFHGKGKTELYRTTALEVFEAMLVSISSRHLQPWNNYMYTYVFNNDRQQFTTFQHDFAMVMMDMIPNQRAGGTIWTIDNTVGHTGVVILNMTPKNGEASVASKGGAHRYELDKIALRQNKYALVSKTLGVAEKMLVRNEQNGANEFVDVADDVKQNFLLKDEEAAEMAKIAMIFDKLYGRVSGDYEAGPSDDADGNTYYDFVQGRPITAHFEDPNVVKTYRLGTKTTVEESPFADKIVLAEGEQVGALAITCGFAYVKAVNTKEWEHATMHDFFAELEQLRKEKAILLGCEPWQVPIIGIFDETTQQMEPWLGEMRAFGSNSGNTTGHTAGYAGEIDVPAFVSAPSVMGKIKTGDLITLDTSTGEPRIYKGELPYVISKTSVSNIPISPIWVSSICGSRQQARKVAYKFARKAHNIGGIDLARLESTYAMLAIFPNVFQDVTNGTFLDLVREYVKRTHGARSYDEVLAEEMMVAEGIVEKVMQMSYGYATPQEYFEKQIQYTMATMLSAYRFEDFSYNVTLRSCDLKMEEFGKQPGAKYYTHFFKGIVKEDMRGAMLLTHDKFRFIYESELKAVAFCRNVMGFENLDYENAFIRTTREKELLDQISDAMGVDSASNSMMFELPSNFTGATRFMKHLIRRPYNHPIKGKMASAKIKIGGNDGVYTNRCLNRLSSKYLTRDEQNESFADCVTLTAAARDAIYTETGIYINLGSCGNGPSLYSEQAQLLKELGYDRVAVTPAKIIPLVFILTGKSMEGSVIEEEIMPSLVLQPEMA